MSQQYPNSGALFTSTNKRNERAPDFFGNIELEKDLLLQMIEQAHGSTFITIKLDGWKKKDRNGNAMVSVKVNTYQKPADNAEPANDGKDPWDD